MMTRDDFLDSRVPREAKDMNSPMVAENMTIPRTFMPSLVPGSVLNTTSGGGVKSREKLWMSVPLSSWMS